MSLMMRHLSATLGVVTLISACGGGAADHSSPTTPSAPVTTTFQGSIAGTGGESGTLDVTLQTRLGSSIASALFPLASFIATLHAQTAVTAAGTLRLASGGTTSLAGTYDSSNRSVSLSGGGFRFSGAIGESVLAGTYTGPNGAGGFSVLNATGSSVTVYCGTATSPEGLGTLNLQAASSGNVSGTAVFGGGPCGLTGRVSGGLINLTSCEGSAATGSVQNGAVVGTTMNRSGVVNGAFAASTGACSGGSSPTPGTPGGPSGPTKRTYAGPFSGTWTSGTSAIGGGQTVVCTHTYTVSGTIAMTLEQQADGTVTGTELVNGTDTVTGDTGTCPARGNALFGWSDASVTGTTSNLTFSAQGGSSVATTRFSFSGALNSGVITGTGVRTQSGQGDNGSGTVTTQFGSATYLVTLR